MLAGYYRYFKNNIINVHTIHTSIYKLNIYLNALFGSHTFSIKPFSKEKRIVVVIMV